MKSISKDRATAALPDVQNIFDRNRPALLNQAVAAVLDLPVALVAWRRHRAKGSSVPGRDMTLRGLRGQATEPKAQQPMCLRHRGLRC